MQRREFIAGAVAVAAIGTVPAAQGAQAMYGMIGKMTAAPGKRDELIAILADDVGVMPGCLSYIVAQDPANANAIWITEVWDSETSHQASLQLVSVREAIMKAKPMIASFDTRIVTTPVGGHGLPKSEIRPASDR